MSASRPKFPCPGCGKLYGWKPEIAGRKAKCACGTVIQVPAESPAVEEAMAPAVAVATPPAAPARAAAAWVCPSCKQPLATGTVICMQCGYNLKTGQRVGTQVESEDVVPMAESPAAHPAMAAPPRPAGAMYPGVPARSAPPREQPKSSQALKIILPAGLVVLLIAGLVVGRFVFKLGTSKNTTPQKGEDAEVKEMIAEQPGTEARQWLEADTNRHMVMGWTREQAQGRIDQWTGWGAKKVYAFGGGVSTMLAIELPSAQENADGRKKLFEWQKQWHLQHHPELRPMEDVGQQYLLIRMKL